MVSASSKILALDYEQNAADLAGTGSRRLIWPILQAPRHSGMCNVLFGDGSVDLKSPDDIDPRDPELNRLWWTPDRDAGRP